MKQDKRRGLTRIALALALAGYCVAPVALAECLVRQGLKTSRKAYPAPPLRKRTWQSGQL